MVSPLYVFISMLVCMVCECVHRSVFLSLITFYGGPESIGGGTKISEAAVMKTVKSRQRIPTIEAHPLFSAGRLSAKSGI